MARRALGPATLAVVQAVERVAAAPLLVACSGGADSLALAAAAAIVGRRRDLPVRAIVVDHGLQPGSDEVAARVVQQLAQGVADVSMSGNRPRLAPMEVSVVAVQVHTAGEGMEAAARQARYQALESAAVADELILLGHTLDDQAETVLLGLARGSGIRSLAGMPARRGPFVRPLLGMRRETTRAACAELGLEPWDDPHNESSGFARARVRHRVLPVLEAELGPGIAEALARTATLARADADLLDDLAARLRDDRDVRALLQPRLRPPDRLGVNRAQPSFAAMPTPEPGGRTPDDAGVPTRAAEAGRGTELGFFASLLKTSHGVADPRASGVRREGSTQNVDVLWLAELPEALRGRVVRSWLVEAGGRDLSAAHVQAVLALVTDWRGQGALDLPGVQVFRRDGSLRATASVPLSPGEPGEPER